MHPRISKVRVWFLALALALHWLPGFYNGRVIAPQRFTDDALPFSMYLNLDKPLIGFWLLLVCPWIVGQRSLRVSLYATALALTLSAVLALGGALLLGIVAWAPKWPTPSPGPATWRFPTPDRKSVV